MAHSDHGHRLANSRTFDRVLEVARASRQGGEVSVAVFDVDDFGATSHRRQCRGRRHPARGGGGARGLGASRGHGRPLRRRRVRPRCAGVRRAHGRATSPGRHRRTARRRGSSHLGLGGARAFPRRDGRGVAARAAGVASQRAREEGAARSARPNEPTARPRRGRPVVGRRRIGSVGRRGAGRARALGRRQARRRLGDLCRQGGLVTRGHRNSPMFTGAGPSPTSPRPYRPARRSSARDRPSRRGTWPSVRPPRVPTPSRRRGPPSCCRAGARARGPRRRPPVAGPRFRDGSTAPGSRCRVRRWRGPPRCGTPDRPRRLSVVGRNRSSAAGAGMTLSALRGCGGGWSLLANDGRRGAVDAERAVTGRPRRCCRCRHDAFLQRRGGSTRSTSSSSAGTTPPSSSSSGWGSRQSARCRRTASASSASSDRARRGARGRRPRRGSAASGAPSRAGLRALRGRRTGRPR